ncbi:MAG TPA: hypothetical protein VHX11_12935, partial [Acidobacteriaceae bacterium]|nr:hypothetical protein [Acidobacteriaceae bacterium]
ASSALALNPQALSSQKGNGRSAAEIAWETLSDQQISSIISSFHLDHGMTHLLAQGQIFTYVRSKIGMKTVQVQGSEPPEVVVTYTGESPVEAMGVANAIAQTMREAKVPAPPPPAEPAPGSAAQELEQSTAHLQALSQAQPTGTDALQAQLPQYLRRDAELQAARSDAASRLAGLQEETDHLQAAGRAASAPAAPAPDPARTALEGQIKAAKERLEELRQRYTDLYPDVEEANGNLASLEARLKAMPAAKPVVEMPKPVLHTAELNTLAAQESDLRNQIGTLDSQIDANQQETGVLRQRLAGAQNLKQQYSVEQQRYKTLLQVQEALDVDGQAPASSGNAPLFTIVKSATSADALGWMFDPLFWIASLALALLASGLSVYLAEQFAPAVHEHMPSRSFYPS